MNLKMYTSSRDPILNSKLLRNTTFWSWYRYVFYSTPQTEFQLSNDFWFELNQGYLEMEDNSWEDDMSEFISEATDEELMTFWKNYNQALYHS